MFLAEIGRLIIDLLDNTRHPSQEFVLKFVQIVRIGTFRILDLFLLVWIVSWLSNNRHSLSGVLVISMGRNSFEPGEIRSG